MPLAHIVPTWKSQSAVSPLLFSAFQCHPGTQNLAPVFVAGFDSADTGVRTEYTCHFEEACEIPLFARDISTDVGQAVSSDSIAIEAAIGIEFTEGISLFKPDGSDCRGTGLLHCIVNVNHPERHNYAATTLIRCFTTFDIHNSNAAPQQRTCHSPPLCLNIRFKKKLESWRELYPGIGDLAAYLETREAKLFLGALVVLRWSTENMNDISGDIRDALTCENISIQYSNSPTYSLSENFCDVPKRYVTCETDVQVVISVQDLTYVSACTSVQCQFRFRVATRNRQQTADDDPILGPMSNSLFLLPPAGAHADRKLIIAGWHSNVLEVWDIAGARRGQVAIVSVRCNQVYFGSMAIDNIGDRLFIIIEPAGDAPSEFPFTRTQELVVLDLKGGERRQIFLGDNIVLSNIEYDEACNCIMAVETTPTTVNSQGFQSFQSSLISLDPETGQKRHLVALDEKPRVALTTYSRRDRVYYYIQGSGDIQRVSFLGIASGGENVVADGAEAQVPSQLSPIRVRGESGKREDVLAMSFCDHDGMLYTLQGPWPPANNDPISLTSYDPESGQPLLRVATPILGSDISFSINAFHVNMTKIVMITSNGEYVTYDMDSTLVTRERTQDIGLRGVAIMAVLRLQNSSPLVTALTTPSVLTNSGAQVTVAGFNFGMRDFSPVVAFLPPLLLPCKWSRWLSDNAIVCMGFPELDVLKNEISGDSSIDSRVSVHNRLSHSFGIIVFAESWDGKMTTRSACVLTFPTSFNIYVHGLLPQIEPYRYRTVFSNSAYLAASGPPTSYNDTHLTFEVPAWLSSAGLATVQLRRFSSSLMSWPDVRVPHAGSAVTFEFTEAWERMSSATSEAEGSHVVTIVGAGFDTHSRSSYFCHLQHNPQEYKNMSLYEASIATPMRLTATSTVISYRHVVCNFSEWPVAAGTVHMWFLHGDIPVPRTSSGQSASPPSLPFVFTQGWKSFDPSKGSMTEPTHVQIMGFGFNTTGVYLCVFSKISEVHESSSQKKQDANVPARLLNFKALECSLSPTESQELFPFASLTLVQVLEGGERIPVTKQGAFQYFEFIPSWLEIRPSNAFASGGQIVEVFGLGFPSNQYECVFSAPSQGEVLGPLETNCSAVWLSNRTLSCLTPQWPYPAGPAKVQVRSGELGSQSALTPASFDFEFLEIVLSEQTSASAYASVFEIAVIFDGFGFGPLLDYECMLLLETRNEGAPTGNESAENQIISPNVTVAATAASVSSIVCPPLSWPYSSGQLHVMLLRGGNAVAGSKDARKSSIKVIEWWTHVSPPREVAAVGAIVTIAGHGFAGTAADYVCEFTQNNVCGKNASFSAPAANVKLELIICPLPAGIGNVQAGLMTVALRKNGQYLVAPPPSSSNVSLHVSEVFLGIKPNSGSAFGGTAVSIIGHGFILPGLSPPPEGLDWTVAYNVNNRCAKACSDTCIEACDNTTGESVLKFISQASPWTLCIFDCKKRVCGKTETELNIDLPTSLYQAKFGGIFATSCEVRNETLIVCSSPELLVAAALVQVVLLRDGNPVKMIGFEETGDVGEFSFRYYEELAAANALLPSFAGALTGVLVNVAGRGFDAGTAYTCMWTTQRLALNLEEPARVANPTLLTCKLGYWPYHAGTSNFTILKNAKREIMPARSLLFFKHWAEVNSSEPNHAPSGVGHNVTVIGAGFDPWRQFASYQCVNEFGGPSEIAVAEEFWKIICCNPIWVRGAARMSIQLIDIFSNYSIPNPIKFQYTQQISKIEPARVASRSSATNITISGGGFSEYSNYFLVLRKMMSHEEGSAGTETPQGTGSLNCTLLEFQSQLLMVFSMPTWPYAAGEVQVVLVMDGIVDLYAGFLPLVIDETLTYYAPDHGWVFGSFIMFQGFSLIQEPIYRCRLQSLKNESEFLMSEFTRPESLTMLEFVIDFWPYSSQEVNLTVLRNDMIVELTGAEARYSVREAWRGTSMLQELSFTGGETVTVVGGGFLPSILPTYQCRWFVARENKQDVLLTSAATALSKSSITCQTPFFSSESGAAKFSVWHAVSENHDDDNRNQVDDSGNIWRKVQQVYLTEGSRSIFFGGGPSLEGGIMNGGIRGNMPITMYGTHFGYTDMSPSSRVGDSSCESTHWVAASLVVCSVPAKGAPELVNDIIITVAVYHIGSSSGMFSYNGPLLKYLTATKAHDGMTIGQVVSINSILKNGVNVTMLGSNFDIFDNTIASRIGGSACVSTRWTSGTSVISLHAHGQGDMHPTPSVLTIVHRVSINTLTDAFTFDFPKLKALGNPAVPLVGGVDSTLKG
jgi:hypothetical protein